jgi:DUF2075 family protein
MLVYSGTKSSFSTDVEKGNLAYKIEEKLKDYGIATGNDREFMSWQNSLPHMYFALQQSKIDDDVSVSIEYQIPLTSRRVDFLIGGANDYNDSIVIVELKQWQRVTKLSRENLVETYTGGSKRVVVHPSQQAYSYAKLIENFNESIREQNIKLIPCAYLHNYDTKHLDQITGPQYDDIIKEAPIFIGEDREKLSKFIHEHVPKSSKKNLFEIIEHGRLKPSKALQDAVGLVMNGNQEFVLVMEQQVAYATVLKLVEKSFDDDHKHTVIVKGGPGTGKSVVAVNLLAKLIEMGKSANYVTKNSAPRYAFSKSLIGGKYKLTYLRDLFRGSGSYFNAKSNTYDCLIIDEAHRLKLKSGYQSNLGENQVKELINASKISVFFLDEDQIVTTSDIGTTDEIKKWARFYGSTIHESEDLNLVSQFRCNGSDGYLAFLDNLLGIRETANKTFDKEFDYDLRIFDDPNEMYEALKEKNTNNKARMIAGYTYEWMSRKDKNAYDIVLKNGFKKQWNFTTDSFATDPESFEQVGCIHSTQGIEFEYVGIIIGLDMRYENGKVIVDKTKAAISDGSSGVRRTRDIALAEKIIRNTYRTLLSRGQKGCFVYCEDENLKNFIRSKLCLY